LLLKVREQLRDVNARLERIGAHVERIDACVCRMARGGPSHAPPTGDAPGPFPVAVRGRRISSICPPSCSWPSPRSSPMTTSSQSR
jgi:hypothetical protein